MTTTAARPAVPEDADELLRLRVDVLDRGPLTILRTSGAVTRLNSGRFQSPFLGGGAPIPAAG